MHWWADGYRTVADHLTAEYRVKTSGRGPTVDEWSLRPGKQDVKSMGGSQELASRGKRRL